ncbi:Nucleotide-binding universal stress protein, UspA family [Halogranum rubrum]|uniref:Nucleotide-binding universal stress protein, UspA family n=1 Tax=Halogranum rubrum TaxID=553466 RepID=A0A1I4CFF3_9EURY|nr:universal stress protein [Halogranum rubrum]SFK79962.1 Nucleotide-binding universal stress protein, UspA family [Halogranum rubrum]
MYDRIVIAVDGSTEAKRAARRGLLLARVFGATVDVLSVVDQSSLWLTKTAAEKTQLRERRETTLTTIEEVAAELDQPVTTKLAEGKPAVQISEYAAEQDADLIVVGRQGLTGLGRRLLGGVTEDLLHRSDIPVLVVPDGDDTDEMEADYSRVLITTDGSENAEAVIPHGIAVAQRYGSEVHVLNIVDLQAAGGAFDAGGLEKEFLERLDERGREAVEKVADEVEESAPDLTVKTAVERTASFEGTAAGIREYVEENEVDLVVMGSHGRSNLRRQLLGSVASTVLRTVDVPVLVVTRSG